MTKQHPCPHCSKPIVVRFMDGTLSTVVLEVAEDEWRYPDNFKHYHSLFFGSLPVKDIEAVMNGKSILTYRATILDKALLLEKLIKLELIKCQQMNNGS